MWMAGLTLPFISLTFLLLALTSPGTWGVALVFWLSDWFNSPSVPLLHSTYLSPSLFLVYCAPRPFLQLAQQVSGIVMWNSVRQKWSNSITYVCRKFRQRDRQGRYDIIGLGRNTTEQKNEREWKLTVSVHLDSSPSSEGKKNKKKREGAGTCSKPCTTTLKCLQPSLHEGCQGLHSNTDQGTSLLRVCISCEIMWRKSENKTALSKLKWRTGH